MEIVACSVPLLAVCALVSLLQFLEKFKLQVELTEKASEECFDATVMVCVQPSRISLLLTHPVRAKAYLAVTVCLVCLVVPRCSSPPPPPREVPCGQLFSLAHRSHPISFTRAQGIPKCKIGFKLGGGRDGRVGERLVEGGGGTT
jgi:hypothetical protein